MPIPAQRMLWLAPAILVPCAALLYLGMRLVGQEDQLVAQRRKEVETRRLEEVNRELRLALEPYRLAAQPPAGTAFHGLIKDGRVLLAWELQPSVAELRRRLIDPAFLQLLQNPKMPVPLSFSGIASEFLELQRSVRTASPEAVFARFANLPASMTDDYGVPLALYAVPRLSGSAQRAALARIAGELRLDQGVISAAGARTALSLAKEDGFFLRLLADAENAESFQAAYASTGGASLERWLVFGTVPFLVGFSPGEHAGEFRFRAVRFDTAESFLRSRVKLSLTQGLNVGEPFAGLRAELPAPPEDGTPRQRPFVFAIIILSFSLGLLGAVLIWRDARRNEELAALRTQFVAAVSHELRTPLTSIRMFTEALHDNPELDARTRQDYLTTMLRENERLSRLVENVLEFSRIERDRRTYRLAPVALERLLESVVSSLRPLLDHNGFRLEVKVEPGLPAVNADREALGQAVSNLLSNAMKYSGESKEIGLRAERSAGRIVIQVRDSGIGIPKAEQRRIFESFYRAPVPENQAIQGTGLGLSLVQHVMRGHGGEVTVESEPGRGSTFTLYLPVPAEGIDP